MKLTRKLLISACAATMAAGSAGAFAPTNFFEPYDPNLTLYKVPHTQLRIGAQAEYGSTSTTRNWDGKKKNVLKIHNDYENAYEMLAGAAHAAELNRFTNPLGGALDQTVGKVYFDGKFEQLDVTVFADYKVPVNIFDGHTQFSISMPIRDVRIKDVKYTPSTLPAIHTANTRDFFNNIVGTGDALKTYVSTHGHGLDLNSWSKTGAGDVVAMLKWGRLFRQDKEWIRSVYLYFKGGVSVPTGSSHHEDKVFSLPLGNEGAVGIPFGLGLALNMKYRIKLGADAEFVALLDHTDDYRLKTMMNQSEFLLLDKGRATKDHGLTWKFNLYLKGVHLWQGFSLKAAYEYTKHDSDSLVLKTNGFDNNIVNSANSLKEWNMHNMIFQLNWDAFKVNKKMVAKPQLGLFYKLPIGGKNVLAPHTFGGQLAVNF